MKGLAGLEEQGALVLGYPFQIFSTPGGDGTTGVYVRPVFTYELTFDVRPGRVEVRSEEPWPEVNLDWLTYALKKPEEQRLFLCVCGLMDRGNVDESLGDGSKAASAPDLKALASGVTATMGDKIKESLRPECISSTQLPTRPDSGIYNRAVLMIGNRNIYTRTLLRELERIAAVSDTELDRTSLSLVFRRDKEEAPEPANGESRRLHEGEEDAAAHEGLVLETFPLNGEQRRAVGAMLTEDLSVVTGPPGTGKSQVVAAGMLNARLRDQSVIFASRNHKALDAIVPRLTLEGRQTLVIRANSKEDSFYRFGFREAIGQILTDEPVEDANAKWEAYWGQCVTLLDRRGALGVQANEVQRLRDELSAIEQELSTLSQNWQPEVVRELDAAGTLFPSPLIATLEEAIGDLRQAPESIGLFPRLRWWLKSLRLRSRASVLRRRLGAVAPSWSFAPPARGYGELRRLSFQLPELVRAGTFCSLRTQALPIETELRDRGSTEGLTDEIKTISESLEEIVPHVLSADVGRRCGLSTGESREDLASLRSALDGLDHPVAEKSVREAVQSRLRDTLPMLLRHFPLWAVTSLSLGSRFPLVPGLFDLAIIDEASQSDIPSAIPVLFRARRASVVGDPRQLSHSTKLSRNRDALLRKRHGLLHLDEQRFTYRDVSLYNLFADTDGVQPILLRDHYRSCGDIAGYCNEQFYGGRLRVVTGAERLNVPKGLKPGIQWTEVISEIRPGGSSGCVAPAEIDAVVRIVDDLVSSRGFQGTLGIVTPFRQQANRLSDRLLESVPYDVRRRLNLVIDTAHGFQGDERDVMIMSLCAGPTMPRGSKAFLRETANLMNVAVSRARAVLHIVGNRVWAERSGMPHLERLAHPPVPSEPSREPFESPWERVLHDALRAKGLEPEPQYPTMGRRLDLALVRDDLKIDIEVDGDRYHRNADGTRKRDDVWRDIQLMGAGWKVIRFWVYQLREDLDGCVDKTLEEWGDGNGR